MLSSSGRIRYPTDSFSKHRASKATAGKSKRSFKEHNSSKRPTHLDLSSAKHHPPTSFNVPDARQLNSTVITISVGCNPPRLFAAHVDVLGTSPYFQSILRSAFYSSESNQISLPDDIPEVFSSVLEFLYKGDYFPKLCYSARKQTWSLENANVSPGNSDALVWVPSTSTSYAAAASPTLSPSEKGLWILKDTAIYCVAEKFGLSQLKKTALRKQGLQAGIAVGTILASARYAYAHTPDSDRHLRAHYLALIIRSRNTFKKSGTMQCEMGSPRDGDRGTGLWFDLFVAMCNHLDDMEQFVKTPK